MATDPQLLSLQRQSAALQGRLDTSPTAYGGEQKASATDVENQVRLQSFKSQMETLKNKDLTKKWGLDATPTSGDTAPPMGLVGGALDYLSRPLYAVAGAAEHALGKGVSPTLSGNITENITTGKRTFKDLLEKEGANYVVAAPLGFALDVALDPVNWATAGVNAIVPRALLKPAAMALTGDVANAGRAVVKGTQSSLAGVAAARITKAVGENTPYLAGTRVGKAMGRATDAAAAASDDYAKLIGRDFQGEILPKNGILGSGVSNYRITLGDLAKQAVKTMPGGQTIWDNLKYSNTDWLRMVKLKDALQKADGVQADASRIQMGEATIGDIQQEAAVASKVAKPQGVDWHNEGGAVIDSTPQGDIDKKFSQALSTLGRTDGEQIQQAVQDAMDIAHNPGLGRTADTQENALRLASEAAGHPVLSMEEVRRMVNDEGLGKTGIEWYDNTMKNIRDMKISANANINRIAPALKGILDFNDKWMTLFRAAKVTSSPSSIVNGAVGNPTFYAMLGGDITDAKYWNSIKGAAGYNLGTKKSSAFWQKLNEVPQIRQWIEENPTAVRTGFAIPSTDRQQVMTARQILQIMKDHGMVGEAAKITDAGFMDKIGGVMDQLKEVIAKGMTDGEGKTFVENANKLNPRGGLQTSWDMIKQKQLKGQAVSKLDTSTGMFGQEYLEQPAARQMLDNIAQKAKAGNPIYKALDIWLNKSPSFYEGIDGSYKLGTFAHLTQNGLTEKELNIMRRTIQMHPEDIMDRWNDNGIWRYRLAPDKAMEAVMESYLNYAAMPGFVRMMRQFPLLQAPFVSFAYGTSLKTANTLATNPALFNKMNFAVNDFGGSKSPLEKEALAGPYYNYLNSQTMFKLPFFQENPLYMNLGYALPYYSLNAFTPSGRTYKEVLPDSLVKLVDKSQLMGNPMGQILFDYAILPHLLSQGEEPQGSFGQSLYPSDATGLEKAGYAGRQLAESVVPGAVAPLGVVQGLAAPSVTDAVPSYRWRQIAHATQGEDQYGITRQEPAASRTLRGVLSSLGIPIQSPIDLTNVANQGKKKKK